MRRRSGVATFKAVIVLALAIGIVLAAYWAGYATADRCPPAERNAAGNIATAAFIEVVPDQRTALATSPVAMQRADRGSASDVLMLARSQAALLTHRGLFARVVADPHSPIRKTDWYKNLNNPIKARQWLEDHLRAEPIPDSVLIRVWLDTALARAEASTILEAVIGRHLDEQQTNATNRQTDRMQSLNSLKVKYETRIRELEDRRNNRLLVLDLVSLPRSGASADNGMSTATEVELQALLQRRADLVGDVATGNSAPEIATTQPTRAPLAAVDERIDQLKQRLGDLAIATADYSAISEDMVATRRALAELKDELDALNTSMAVAPIVWASHPVHFDDLAD